MSAKQMSLRIVAATTIALALLTTVTVLNWPDVSVATPRGVRVVTKTPPGCEQFVATSDAFVSVTEDFLGVQNEALDALLSYDTKSLTTAVDNLKRLQGRYDAVMDRYLDARAGCL